VVELPGGTGLVALGCEALQLPASLAGSALVRTPPALPGLQLMRAPLQLLRLRGVAFGLEGLGLAVQRVQVSGARARAASKARSASRG
jgi:hypothetical protein